MCKILLKDNIDIEEKTMVTRVGHLAYRVDVRLVASVDDGETVTQTCPSCCNPIRNRQVDQLLCEPILDIQTMLPAAEEGVVLRLVQPSS